MDATNIECELMGFKPGMFNLNSDFLAEILGDECCAIYIQLKMQFGVTHHYPVWFPNDHINIIIPEILKSKRDIKILMKMYNIKF